MIDSCGQETTIALVSRPSHDVDITGTPVEQLDMKR